MKSPTIDRKFIPLCFLRTQNRLFRDEESAVTVRREMTSAEKKTYRSFQFWRNWSFALMALYFVFVWCLVFAIAHKYGNIPAPIIVLGIALAGMVVSTILNSHIVGARDSWLISRQKFGFAEEVKAFRDYDRIIEGQAQAWRTAHPLEEKIRIATESKNCVDIAEVIREITKGELNINGKS